MADITIGLISGERIVLDYNEETNHFTLGIEDNMSSFMVAELSETEIELIKGCIISIMENSDHIKKIKKEHDNE